MAVKATVHRVTLGQLLFALSRRALAGQIRARRTKLGWKLIALADRSGYSPSAMSRLENYGYGGPRLVRDVSDALGL